MLKSSAWSAIRLRGVRHNNLKNFDLELPLNQLIVVTGLSGSGKSSLAFDTLFAEGQRRYIETFSPYARQFFDRMDKPQVDSIEGIPPAIAIEQRNAVKTTRSTVGTMTEICDYMKLLWPHVAQLHCRKCGQPVRKDSPRQIWESRHAAANGNGAAAEALITFDLPLSEKLPLDETLSLVSRQGYQRLLHNGRIINLDEAAPVIAANGQSVAALTVVQDRVRLAEAGRARFVEACEQAYHFGKGILSLWDVHLPSTVSGTRRFSNRLHCATCDIEYREPSPALFSFNHPVGACPACRGFGRVISIDYDLVLPDHGKTLAEGVVKPWQSGQSAECQADLLRMCRRDGVPTDVPFARLPKKWQDYLIEGEPGYGKDAKHRWPRAWYGVKGYFRWLESKAYKMHVRVLLSRYRAYTLCPECHGRRFQLDSLLYRCEVARGASRNGSRGGTPHPGPLPFGRGEGELSPASIAAEVTDSSVIVAETVSHGTGLTLADFYQLPIRDAVAFLDELAGRRLSRPGDPLALVLGEVRSRLGYLADVGLGYLTLDRPTRSLSGGETERVNLTTCLGSRLVNTLFVLDEPSVGLHPRDTERLVRILQQLRDAGNTVVVVEHEASVMRAANQIVDLGPGHGADGGHVVFQGTYKQILKAPKSLTGQYLSGKRNVEVPIRRPVAIAPLAAPRNRRTPMTVAKVSAHDRSDAPVLKLAHAARNNLKDLSVQIPLERFVCLTGVSGSGKTTLLREVLLPALAAKLKSPMPDVKVSDRLDSPGADASEDNDSTPGAPGAVRLEGAENLARVVLVDQSILAKTPRSNPAVYIGAFDDIREVFADSDVARRRGLSAAAFSFNSSQGQCERCRGAGFEKIEMQFLSDVFIRCPDCQGRRYRQHILEVKISPKPNVQDPKAAGRKKRALSIADVLESTVEEGIDFLAAFAESRPAQRARASLALLAEVGLGYLKLGQPINTLSGGESQRLKLVRHLAESLQGTATAGAPVPTLFLFDEPTTGLHFEDVRVLLKVFQRLVDARHSVAVIEHNMDVIKSADWVIDLGPEAGDDGGQIVAQGTPEDVARCPDSHTGKALRDVLPARAN